MILTIFAYVALALMVLANAFLLLVLCVAAKNERARRSPIAKSLDYARGFKAGFEACQEARITHVQI